MSSFEKQRSLSSPIRFVKDDKQYQSVLEIDPITLNNGFQESLGKSICFKLLSVNATETFRKRGVIEKKEDYQLASHMNEAKEKLKNRVDKASVWLNTNVTEREELLSFEKHLQMKKARMQSKVDEILKKVDSIGLKLQELKLIQMRKTFLEEDSRNQFVIPSDPELEASRGEFRRIKRFSEDIMEQVQLSRDQKQKRKEKRWADSVIRKQVFLSSF